ncbi:uncharacterized protein LOC132630549 [Lycium barbarum]|uniref:uncharacterized protein LOC132630549 n=1 Tax=Lycium barbarum TaxID=112863 RepID=UPI00293EC46C|nr:uncharacterized protein LOC132630549 [Lycium barbarum]XP_060202106.1 uncharacterized protein LOC132630549 [Lycium barbarum]XP_060202107.1 uncharacterized protein LOC132630549 [Lycium barbarum]
MGDAVFKEMKEHWESAAFKKKFEQNKKNRDSNAGASLHTGGCIPHRVIYKRMNNFERKKQELSASQSASVVAGDTNSASQSSQLSEMDIWVQFVGGKKKGRVAGLVSLGRSVKAHKQSTSALAGEIDEMIKSQVHASNADLYAKCGKNDAKIRG